ncbi:MAG: diaminopimelate decarboxylase [Cyanobacteria bacterium SIG30]|nr:diaminopimelate decarboxylase [Cyanobacteria bacterium SIG30]
MQSANQNIKPLTTKINEKGNLSIGGCDLAELAKKYSTPLYVIDKETLVSIAREYKNAFKSYAKFKPKFASKALMTSAIAKILADEGYGFDVVSGGEIYTVHNAGISLNNSTFNGNNKSREELNLAIDLGIGRISVDNFSELELLNEILEEKNKTQKILLRVTPGIECHTHEYIQTGHLDSKFGFDLTQIDNVIELITQKYKNLEIMGLHAHVGSQIFETKVWSDEVEVLIKEIKRIKDKFKIELEEINIGGGLGITYTKEDTPPSVQEVANVVLKSLEENIKKYNVKEPVLYIEPGRSMVGTSGVTLYTLGSSKQVPNGKKYIAVDGGMADNIRPSMYGAEYCAELVTKKDSETKQKVTIAGKFCESGDILIKEIELNNPQKGDILCVYNTGAYGYSMASNYNLMLKPMMVLVNNSQSAIIVNRQTYAQLVQNDIIAEI